MKKLNEVCKKRNLKKFSVTEMTSDRLVKYYDKATADRAKAEKEGDEKRVAKRTKGAYRALDKLAVLIKKEKGNK